MNLRNNAEAGATTGRPCLNRQGQGTQLAPVHMFNLNRYPEEDLAQGTRSETSSCAPVEASAVNGSQEPGAGVEARKGAAVTALDEVSLVSAPSQGSQDVEAWTQVKRRRRKKDELDKRSIIVWKVPHCIDPATVDAVIKDTTGTAVTSQWRGRGINRHLLVEFASTLHYNSASEAVRHTLEAQGLKPAKTTRNFETRQRHRAEKQTAKQASSKRQALDFLNSIVPGPIPLNANEGNVGPPTSNRRKAPKKKKPKKRKNIPLLKLQRQRLHVGSLNVDGGLKDKIGELEEYLGDQNFDVVAVQESRLPKGQEIQARGFRVFFQDKAYQDDKSNGGVIMLIASRLEAITYKEPCTHANQLWIHITGTRGKRDLFVCSAYMPQEQATKEDREEAFLALETSAKKYSALGDILILGDLNAKLGPPTTPLETRIVGRYGDPTPRTANGSLVVSMMKNVGLMNLGAQRSPPEDAVQGCNHWYTRRDKEGGLYTIDYALMSSTLDGPEVDFSVSYVHLNTDHHLLSAWTPSPRRLVRRRGRKKVRRVLRLDKMIQRSSQEEDIREATAHREKYVEEIKSAFEGFKPIARERSKCQACDDSARVCVCAAVADFIHRNDKAAEEALGTKSIRKEFSRSWFDDEARAAVSARRAAYASYLSNPTAETFDNFRKLRRKCKKIIKRKKAADWATFMDRMEEAYRNDRKLLWRLVNRLTPSGKKISMTPILNTNQELAHTEEAILEAWANHQEALGTPKADPHQDKEFARRVEAEVAYNAAHVSATIPEGEIDRPFTDAEIEQAIEDLDYHKAEAEDGTRNPLYKCGGAEIRTHLRTLFNFLLEHETMPESWCKAVIVNLYKEGDRTDPGNYRGIALISCLGKLYLKLWATRLGQFLERTLHDGQGGFRSGRSTVDQANTLVEVLLRRKRQGKSTYLFFVDFRKAFDTVWHAGLWKRLWDSGVQGKAWRVLRSLYSSIHASVRVGDQTSRFVRMRQGVRQGCPVSPILFNCFIDELSRMLDAASPDGEPYGVKVARKALHSLLYADDVVLMAESPEELQKLINVVDAFCQKWHLDINLKKSEAMVVGTDIPGCDFCSHTSRHRKSGCCARTCRPWVCRGVYSKVVTSYKYLGLWITSDLSWTEHINIAVAKAKERSASLAALMNNNRVPARAKLLVWFAYVRPLLEYGSEIWVANSKQAARLESIQLQAGIQAFKLNRKCNAHAVRALMHVPTLHLRRERARLKYLVKIKTMDPNSIVRSVAEEPEEKAVKGRARQYHWMTRTLKTLNGDTTLRTAYRLIEQSLLRNSNALPVGLDPTLPHEDNAGRLWYNPSKAWDKAVKQWVKSTNLMETRTKNPGMNTRKHRSSTLDLINQACAGQDGIPLFPLTKAPNVGPDQIRLRLLCGTSALNKTMSRVSGGKREAQCPDPRCRTEEEEDAVHFLTSCATYADLRTEFLAHLKRACTCAPSEDQTCHAFFTSLDNRGKALFMLGGPINGRTPETPVDSLARTFVLQAYDRRSQVLTKQAEDPEIIDPNRGASQVRVGRYDIRSFFPSQPARNRLHAYMPRPDGQDRSEGSGLNGQQATGID